MKRSKILRIALSVTMLLVLLVAAGLLPINLWFAKGAIERYASENLDVDLALHGALRLRLGPFARLDAMLIEARKSGSNDEELVRITALSAKPDLTALLRGNIHLEEFRIAGTRVDYCAAFPIIKSAGDDIQLSPSTSTSTSIAVDSFSITDLQVFCKDPQDRQSPSILVEELTGSAPTGEAIELQANGRFNEVPFQITADGGNLNALLVSLDGFPLHLVATAEGAKFSVNGEINQVLDSLEMRAEGDLSIQNPQNLLANMGFEVPSVPDIDISLLSRMNEDAIEIEKFEAQIGVNDMQGMGSARFSSDRNYFAVDVHVGHLDLASFGQGSDQKDASDERESLDLATIFSSLSGFDGRAQIMADQVTSGSAQLEGIELEASLSSGALDISRLKMNVMGGSVEATASLDLQAECQKLTSYARASNIDLKLLAEMVELEIPVTGSVGGLQIQTESCGSSIIAHRNTTQFQVDLSGVALHHPDLNTAVSLDKLKLDTGWSGPTQLTIDGHLLEEQLSIEMKGGTIEKLIAGDQWPVNIDVRGAGVSLAIDGKIAIGDSMLADLSLDMDAPKIGAMHRLIGVDPKNELALSANTIVRWANESLSIADISVELGRSELSGQVDSRLVQQEVVLVTSLRSTRVDVVEILEVFLPIQTDNLGNSSDESRPFLGFHLPSVDLDVNIKQLILPDLEISDIEIHGRARDQLIDDANLKMRVDELLLEGTLDLDLRTKPGKFSYQATAANLNVGQLLQDFDVASDMDITAQSLKINYETYGANLQDVAINGDAHIEMRNLEWGRDDSDFRIARFEVSTRHGGTTVLSAEGSLDDVPLSVRAELPHLGDVLYGNKTTQMTVAASSGNIAGMFSGALDWSNLDQLSGQLELSVQRMDSDAIDLSLLESPLQGITVRTDLMVREREILAENFSAHMGTSSVNGSVKVLKSERDQGFEIRLQAPRIQTLDLVPIIEAMSGGQMQEPLDDPSDVSEHAEIEGVFRKYVDEQTLGRSFDVKIDIEEVYAGENFLGRAQIGLLADSDDFKLQPFVVSLPSGDINVEYIVEKAGEGYVSNLDMYIERLQYGDLAQLYDPDAPKEMRGLLYLDTALSAAAPTLSELRSTLQGKVEFLVIPEDINAGVLDLWAANLIVSLLSEDAGKPKKLNCMVAGFSVDDGVMKSKGVMLDSTDIIVRGKGEIDLANRTIELVAVPQAKLEKFLSMSTPLAVTGPWNDMQIGVGGAGFIGTLFRWYMSLIYVPYKWITGERFPENGVESCFEATDWEFVSES